MNSSLHSSHKDFAYPLADPPGIKPIAVCLKNSSESPRKKIEFITSWAIPSPEQQIIPSYLPISRVVVWSYACLKCLV